MQKCACTSTTSATAYPKSPVQHHCTTNDCPGPSPEASEYPPALHTLEHSESEIQTCRDPTDILNELQFIGETIWNHNYFFLPIL